LAPLHGFRTIARCASLLLLALAAFPAAAQAAFPGANGPLVVSVEGCSFEQRYLATMPWRGGALTPITPQCDVADQSGEVGYDVISPDASPDGRTIIAVQQATPYDSVSGPPDFSFTTLRPDGSERKTTPLPHSEHCCAHTPSFAPDGLRFAFDDDQPSGGQGGSIWETRLDGTGTRAIRRHPPCGPEHGRRNCSPFQNPRWSPDGKLIAIVVGMRGYDLSEPYPVKPGIWLIRARDGKLVRRIAKHGGWVDWSPDGRRLVYGTSYGRAGTRAAGGNLYVVGRDGRKVRQLVHREAIAETQPTWSPDGRSVAWVSLRFEGGGDVSWDIHASLWRVRASGGKPKRIGGLPSPEVEEGDYQTPELTWLPEPR
jgi:Tol biopolymer transport system component